ncbi:sensor histidine kinase [Butyrivibrio sp. WCE2006]|uniref:sensor histidine kinase n=1 Tax=Butyrivibrio sp. WCE2006 TaxID=1410611 RepID=UPI0005D2C482|nr:sensor histidine kinase [Butyrivibrio sp. WCE2006]
MDMEKYWDIANMAFRIMNLIVNAGMMSIFVKPFLREKKNRYVVMTAFFLSMLLLLLIPYEISSSVAYGIGIVASFSLCTVADRYNQLQKIFLAVSSYLILWIASGVINEPWNQIWKLTLGKIPDERIGLQFAAFIVLEALNIVLENAVLYFMIKLLHRVYKNKQEIMTAKELFLLLSPYLSIASGYWVIQFLTNVYEMDTSVYLWNEHTIYRGLVAGYQILSFAAIVTGVMSYGWIKESEEDRIQRAVIAGQIKDMKDHVDKIEGLYQGIRSIKHDINNHILVLEELVATGNEKDAKEYLEAIKKDFAESGSLVKTGNPVTDVIISEKQKDALDKGMEFSSSFAFPQNVNISTYDISVVLGNILSNAFEAAHKSAEKRVNLSSVMKGQIFFIEVRNSFDGALFIDEATGLPKSNKDQNQGHGYGLRNVKKVAEKYFGTMEIIRNDDEVRTTVMMVMPS